MITKSSIIVESKNDGYTFEAIIRHMALAQQIEILDSELTPEFVYSPAEDNVEKPTALKNKIKGLIKDSVQGRTRKIGVIWDIDDKEISSRIELVNTAIDLAISDYIKQSKLEIKPNIPKIMDVGTFITISIPIDTDVTTDVEFACYFVGIKKGGALRGEIEDVLKIIQTKESPLADCVDKCLPNCLHLPEDELRDKDLVKLWVNNYVRFDFLKKDERTSANTTWENVMKKHSSALFNFDKNIEELIKLKDFLKKFT